MTNLDVGMWSGVHSCSYLASNGIAFSNVSSSSVKYICRWLWYIIALRLLIKVSCIWNHNKLLECGTWYHHPQRHQCVLSRNLRTFKVTKWHCRCRHHLKVYLTYTYAMLRIILQLNYTYSWTTIQYGRQMRHQAILETQSKSKSWLM